MQTLAQKDIGLQAGTSPFTPACKTPWTTSF
jgi:hypothetical protein